MPRDGERNLYRHKESGIWWVRIRVDGNEYRRSTEAKSRREATQAARKIVAELVANPPRQQIGDLSIESLAAEDIVDAENRGVSGAHIEALESQWCMVADVFGPDYLVSDLSVDELRAYEGERRRRGVRGQTIRRELALLRRSLRRARRRGHVDRDWAFDLDQDWPTIKTDPPDRNKSGKLWPIETIRRYLEELRAEARAEATFAVLTGLRWAELKRVTPDMIERRTDLPTPALMRLPESVTKTRRGREVGLPAPALAIVDAQLSQDPSRQRIFSATDYKGHRRHVSRDVLGLEHTITLRDLRHCYASYALRGGQDPTAVMRAMGHTDLKMTERYLSAPLEGIASAGASVAGALMPDEIHNDTDEIGRSDDE